jgi:hypothetical protein
MRLLFDEGTPWPLRHYLPGHEVFTTKYMGWDGKTNGELLALARDGFDVLITVDQSMPYQQNIDEGDVAVVVLAARTNDVDDLRPLVPELLHQLHFLKRGEVVRIEA